MIPDPAACRSWRRVAPGSPLSNLGSAKRLSSVHSHSTMIKEGAMKYLLLVSIDEKKLDAMSKAGGLTALGVREHAL